MGRLILLILLLVLVFGGLFFLSTMDGSKPLTRVEKTVPADALPR